MLAWKNIFDDALILDLKAGEVLFRREDKVRMMYLVREGTVALERSMKDGSTLTLHMAHAGTALAEASLFAETYHCDAIVRVTAQIATLPREKFLSALKSYPTAALSLIDAHTREIQAQRSRVEILRLRRVSDKLDAWISLYGTPQKGEWSWIADQIGVSPPALYRELAKRRRNQSH